MKQLSKIESLEDLERHINAFADKQGSDFTFQDFERAMSYGVSARKMMQLARCNYRTIVKWRSLYKNLSV